ncbi:hypothetical protein SSP24_48320 [Streptomyces spinoverrucosus]|uniref:Uncharacterized protein n=1 Tax=Streptomyces spinoverrucosus TaxID=284043 RepID=A0A4Y3VJY7_9ACTN|nr:hypothetical protein SSP24_48320 [Streptomyces spinoverrucosus]GHB80938.1 hypothetical protein GCM10010397_59710 [Streptomyces spinoverrucosus]
MPVTRRYGWGSPPTHSQRLRVLGAKPPPTSEHSRLNEVTDRVLGPPEDDPPVPVAERDKVGPRCDAGLGQQAEGQLNTALVIDVKFGWFPEHEERVALSLSEDVDRLGL